MGWAAVLSALAVVSKIAHWKKADPYGQHLIKAIAYCVAIVGFIICISLASRIKGNEPWSHLSSPGNKPKSAVAAPAVSPLNNPTQPLNSNPTEPEFHAAPIAPSRKIKAKSPPPKPPATAVENNCPNGICISGGTVNGNPMVINNPAPPEQTWQLSTTKCDEWMTELDLAGSGNVEVGNFISDNNAGRIASILAACFGRSKNWKASRAVLPVNPDGVQLGASANGELLDAVERGLHSIGLRIPGPHDIRPSYGGQIGIIVGTNPIDVHLEK